MEYPHEHHQSFARDSRGDGYPRLSGESASSVSVVLSTTPIATVLGTTFSDTSLTPTGVQAFYYVVMATDSDNPGNSSAPPTKLSNPALPQSMAPPGPVSLTGALSTTSYGVSLSWTNSLSSEGVSSYQVLQNAVTINPTPVPYNPNLPTVTYFDSTIPGTGAPVTYTVLAQNGYGTTASNLITVTVAECNEGPITVTPDATTNSVTISWGPPLTPGFYGVGGYAVYKSLYGVPAANPTPIATGGATATPTPSAIYTVVFSPTVSFTITPVIDTTITNHMSYWVQPLDSNGHGGVVGTAPALNLAPTPPSSVGVAAPVGNNQIAVSWTEGTPGGFFNSPQNYVIFRLNYSTQTITPTPRFVAKVPYPQTSYTDIAPELTPGTLLAYQVELADALGNKSDPTLSSSDVTIDITPVFPLTPQVLPFSGSVSSITFSWRNPRADSVTNYQVYGSDYLANPTVTYVATVVPPTGTPTWVFNYAPSPIPWVANNYYVVAQNASGSSTPAAMGGIPGPAYNVTAVVPSGSQQVSLNWSLLATITPTPVIDSYDVYRSLAPESNFTPIATVLFPTAAYMDILPSPTPGVTYYYRVTGKSGQSAESPLYLDPTLTPVVTPDPYGSVLIWPNAPSGVTALSGANATTLNWAGNSSQEAVTGYSVYLDATQTPIAIIPATPGPTYSYVSQETPGNLSFYNVQANNISGPSVLSQAVSVLVPPTITPGISLTPPTYVIPTPGQTPAFSPSVWITGITYLTPVSGYSINRAIVQTPNSTPTYVSVNSVSNPVSYYQDTSFVPGYVNYYQVVANNGSGVTANPAASAKLGIGLWPNPPNFSFTGTANSVTLAWATPTGNVNVTGFDIYRSLYPTTTPNPTPLASLVVPVSIYSDSPVSTGMAYIYWMDAQNARAIAAIPRPKVLFRSSRLLLALLLSPKETNFIGRR